jgi:hypothetical protein
MAGDFQEVLRRPPALTYQDWPISSLIDEIIELFSKKILII